MYSKEPLGTQNARITQRIEEMEAKDEDRSKGRQGLCISCLLGSVLGISALTICYLVFLTAAAYAIP